MFKWANAASFSVHAGTITTIASLPFVKDVLPVATVRVPAPGALKRAPGKRSAGPGGYGHSLTQLALLGVPQAHRYIQEKGAVPGEDVLVGVFDEGFWLGHPSYDSVVARGAVVADSDFVTHSPDPYVDSADHGMQVMALIAGHEPDSFAGIAWGADFIVARTEQSVDSLGQEYERHVEEDNWAAAMVWAESLGVDIVTTSVAYRGGFTSPDTDYVYEDMDGNTAIIARAAQWGIDRGVIVVSAMGNEGSFATGTLVSPADVEDVVAVGAVDADRRIAFFSSTGPTADGRIKPDLVAMGLGVSVPNTTGYGLASGTSFATPMVAGLVALVKQMHPAASPQDIRERVYRACALSPYQDSVDNYYGRGIPDALHACIAGSDVYLLVEDTLSRRVAGAEAYRDGTLMGVSDSFGAVVFSLDESALPETVSVHHSGMANGAVIVRSVQSRNRVVLDHVLRIRVADPRDSLVQDARIHVREQGNGAYTSYTVDSNGVASIPRYSTVSYEVYATAPGYVASGDTLIPFDLFSDTVAIILKQRSVSRFAVLPNVLSLSDIKDDATMRIDFMAMEDVPLGEGQWCQIAVRSLNGDAVWEFAGWLTAGRAVADKNGAPVVWDGRSRSGRAVAPGVYFVIVHYGGSTYKKKVLITG
ncbi:MAG: S8 family serine peptidase [Chitinivibrionales bacterium]|nr:S8 family serine peptidase [Chitinivibrionales bacterium]MBD3397258.1 S8 family serine peptidase [Chitinivibrionales bacterium]